MKFIDNIINKALTKQLAQYQTYNVSNLNTRELLNFVNGYNLPTLDGDNHDYYNAFRNIGAIYEVTDLIRSKIASADIIVYEVKDAKKLKQSKQLAKSDPIKSQQLKAQSINEISNHEILKVLEKPNEYMNQTQFISTCALMYMLRGNCYVYGNKVGKKVKQLFPFSEMEIVADIDSLLDPIRGYIYNVDGLDFAFTKDEMCHIKTANPRMISRDFQYLYGVSPLRAYLESLRTIEEGQKQASKQMKNGGVFGILSPEDKEDQFSINQREALAERLKEARRANDELGRIIPSSIKLKWQSMGLPSSELRLLEQVGASQKDIYRAYHVPLQYHNQEASTSNNQQTAVKQLIYDAVTPITEALNEMLTDFLAKSYGNYIVEIDLSTLPEMAVNLKEIADYISPLWKDGLITRNEARYALKYDELSGGIGSEFYTNTSTNDTNQNSEQ